MRSFLVLWFAECLSFLRVAVATLHFCLGIFVACCRGLSVQLVVMVWLWLSVLSCAWPQAPFAVQGGVRPGALHLEKTNMQPVPCKGCELYSTRGMD